MKQAYNKRKTEVLAKLEDNFKEYNAEVDRKLFETLMELYVKDQQPTYVSPLLMQKLSEQQQTYMAVAADLYSKTAFHRIRKNQNHPCQ
jgi:hypothetical protein